MPGKLAASFLVGFLAARSVSAGTTPVPVLSWERHFSQPQSGIAATPKAARILPDGTIVVVTFDDVNDGDVSVTRFQPDGIAIGAVMLELTRFRLGAIDACGDVILADSYRREESDDYDVWVFKYDGVTGRPLWAGPVLWNGPTGLDDIPISLALDDGGNALVTATSDGTWVTLRLDATDGGVAWTSVGILEVEDGFSLAATAVDLAGNVHVAASTRTGFLSAEPSAWMLNGQTGALLWGPVTVDTGTDQARVQGIALDFDGNVVIAGNRGGEAFAFRLLGSNGQILWGPLGFPGPAVSPFHVMAMSIGADGSIFLAGIAGPSPTANFLACLDVETGLPRWDTFRLESGSILLPPALRPASNGDMFFSGSFANDTQIGTARFGRDGALIWGFHYRDTTVTAPILLVDSSGDVLELFRETPYNGGSIIAKRSGADGQSQWVYPFQGLRNLGFPLATTWLPSGDTILAIGRVDAEATLQVTRLDQTNGTTAWGASFPAPFNSGTLLASDPAGNVFVTIRDADGQRLYKLSGATGTLIWGPIASASLPFDISIDGAGNVVLSGEVEGSFDANLEKRSSVDGALLWGPRLIPRRLTPRIQTDGAGDILVAGSQFIMAPSDWVVSKHSGSTGAQSWARLYDRAGLPDSAFLIGILPGGDVVIGGSSSPGSGGFEATLFRYSGATGATVWGPLHFPGPLNEGSGPVAVRVDASGNLFLLVAVASTPPALMLYKLQGSDGTTLWGPFSVLDERLPGGRALLELDAAGDPILITSAPASPTFVDQDLVLRSWNGVTGAPTWGPILHGGVANDGPLFAKRFGATTTVVGIEGFFGNRLAGNRTVVSSWNEALGISTPPGDLLATCNESFSLQLEAGNVSGSATWTLASGSLPDGLGLSAVGLISGTPTEPGEFPITVQVQDSSLATATRELTIVVREDGMVPIVATPVDDCTWMLSVPGSWTTYAWEPSDETTSTITVSPLNDTIYGVTVDDGSGCTVCGSVLIRATRLIDPDCDAPGLTAISPTSGPAAGGTLVILSGSQFEGGTQTRVDAIPVLTSFQDASTLTITTPLLEPGTLNNVLVVNSNSSTAMLRNAFFADFLDVDQLHPFHDFVEALVRGEVTAGCGGGNYCPDSAVTREQMAVFLLRSKEGPTYAPPVCTMPAFSDVPCSSLFAPWINELVARGVTVGCGGGNYCPADPVTREQMAVFLLRTLEGPTYTPPDCAMPTFSDVPCSSPFARWIEELVLRGITAGCGGGLYCPLLAVSRGQMAVFLTVTFAL
jgi:hypothetical protein